MPREASRVGQTEREDSFHSYYWKFDFYSFMCYNIGGIIWKKQIFIDGIETVYTVSDEGVIKNSKTGRVMTINKGNVQLNVNGKGTGRSVGKIVAEAFLKSQKVLL